MKRTTYRKECTIRLVGVGGVEVTIPKLIIDRAARAEGQSLEEFVKSHKLVHLFNDFTDFDAAYRFERVKSTEVINIDEAEEIELKQPEKKPKMETSFNSLRNRLNGGK